MAAKRKWTKRLAKAALALVLLVVLAGAVMKYWVGPWLIHREFAQAAGKLWQGQATLGQVEFNYRDPIVLQDMQLADANGRSWLHAGRIEVSLDWPGVLPVVVNVHVRGLQLSAHQTGGRVHPPLKPRSPEVAEAPSPAPQAKSKSAHQWIALRQVTVNDCTVALFDAQGTRLAGADISLSAVQQAGPFAVALDALSHGGEDRLAVRGTIDPNGLDCKLALDAKYVCQAEQSQAVLSVLGAPYDLDAEGRLAAKLKVEGPLDDLTRLDVRGLVTLDGGAVHLGSETLVQDASFALAAEGERLTLQRLQATAGELQAAIESLSLGHDGAAIMKSFTLRDAAGRQWLGAGGTRISLRFEPHHAPAVTDVKVETLELAMHFDGSVLKLPRLPQFGGAAARASRRSESPSPRPAALGGAEVAADKQGPRVEAQLPPVKIETIAFTLAQADGTRQTWPGLQLQAWARGAAYEIDLHEGLAQRLGVRGTIDTASAAVDCRAKIDRAMTPDETAAIARVAAGPAMELAAGIAGELHLAGVLSDANSIRITAGCDIRDGRGIVAGKDVEGLAASVQVQGVQVTVRNAGVRTAGRELCLQELHASGQGPLTFRKLDVSDVQGRPMLTVGRGSVLLEHGELAEAEADDVSVIVRREPSAAPGAPAQAASAQASAPQAAAGPASAPAVQGLPMAALRKATLQGGRVTLIAPGGGEHTWDNLAATVTGAADGLHVDFARPGGNGGVVLQLAAHLEPNTLAADANVVFDIPPDEAELGTLLQTLGVPLRARAAIHGRLRVQGRLDEPLRLSPVGEITLSQGRLSDGNREMISDLSLRVNVDANELTVSAVRVAAGDTRLAADQLRLNRTERLDRFAGPAEMKGLTLTRGALGVQAGRVSLRHTLDMKGLDGPVTLDDVAVATPTLAVRSEGVELAGTNRDTMPPLLTDVKLRRVTVDVLLPPLAATRPAEEPAAPQPSHASGAASAPASPTATGVAAPAALATTKAILQQYVNLRSITMDSGMVTLDAPDDEFPPVQLGGWRLTGTGDGRVLAIDLRRTDGNEATTFQLMGGFDQLSWYTSALLEVDWQLPSEELGMALAAATRGRFTRAGGLLRGSLLLTGRGDLPAQLETVGAVEIAQAMLADANGLAIRNAKGTVRLRRQRVEFENFAADVFDGKLEANLAVSLSGGALGPMRGNVHADRLSLPLLTAALGGHRLQHGRGSGNISFSSGGLTWRGFSARGYIFTDDADLMKVQFFPHLLGNMGLESPEIDSDAAVTFTVNGPVLKLAQAQLSNEISALETEPGGTVNLETKELDFYVIGVPIKQIRGVLMDLPVLQLFWQLKDKLTRLHIKGAWDEPPAKLVHKEPLKDVGVGTMGFMRQAARDGGQFGKSIMDSFGKALQAIAGD